MRFRTPVRAAIRALISLSVVASLVGPLQHAAATEVAPTTILSQGPQPGAVTFPARKMGDFIAADPRFTMMAKAISAAGLTKTLNNEKSLTVFVPDDQAFRKVPKAELDKLFANPAKLKQILLHHVVKGEVDALTLITTSPTLTALDGKPLKVVKIKGIKYTRVDDVVLIGSNLVATNGLVHVINDLIYPGVVKPTAPPGPRSAPIPDPLRPEVSSH